VQGTTVITHTGPQKTQQRQQLTPHVFMCPM